MSANMGASSPLPFAIGGLLAFVCLLVSFLNLRRKRLVDHGALLGRRYRQRPEHTIYRVSLGKPVSAPST